MKFFLLVFRSFHSVLVDRRPDRTTAGSGSPSEWALCFLPSRWTSTRPGSRNELRQYQYAAWVREDVASRIRNGVNGTPTFYINGARHDAPYNLEILLVAINAAAVPGPHVNARRPGEAGLVV